MKTIIVPTDYSENAWNATKYAAHIAQKTGAKLVLFHAFELPLIATDVPVDVPNLDDITKQHKKLLEELKYQIVHLFPVEVSYEIKMGSVVNELRSVFKQQQADLVVTGLRGTNPLVELLMGSTPVSLLKKGDVPVLVVPPHCAYHSIRRILFACDFEPPHGWDVLRPLKDIAKAFEAMVEILHLPQTVATTQEYGHDGYWENEFRELKHGYTFLYHEDIREGIDQGVKESKADLLVMMPHRHNFFERLLNRGNTQRMVFHTQVPLLALVDDPARS
jgi:nucleotide-binding universal stress UspA family protein